MKKTAIFMGLVKILLSVLWMGLGILGIIYGLKGIRWVEDKAGGSLAQVKENLEIIHALLAETTDVMEKVDRSLSTVETSFMDAGWALKDSRLIIDKSSQVIVQDVPLALDDVQASMPAVIDAAATIDQTLTLLSKFNFSLPNPFGADWAFNLGVNYDPEIPLEQALDNLSKNLEGIPGEMRAMEADLATANINMSAMSKNMLDIAYDLDLIREQMADIPPQLERMVASLEAIQVSVEEVQDNLPIKFKSVRIVIISLMVLLIMSQVPSLYLGYLMTVTIWTKEPVIKIEGESGGDSRPT